MLQTWNPATGTLLAEYLVDTSERVHRKLEQASCSYREWKFQSLSQRADFFRTLAKNLRAQAPALAELMALEMGKPVTQGISEAEKCAWVCEYYAENAEAFLKDQPGPPGAGKWSFVSFQPLGAILGVMPWNFPFWQVFRFAVPSMMAGNVALLKHASNVTGCAQKIGSLFEESGFPTGAFQVLYLPGSQVSDVIADARVSAVSLTGSTQAGKSVAAAAGAHLKKCVLELGGSDPYLIFADADLELTVEACAQGRMINSGQSCIAAKRFIVEASIYEEFSDRLVERLKSFKMGEPRNSDVLVGPLARRDLMKDLERQVEASIQKGARSRKVTQHNKTDPAGNYFQPVVLTDVVPGMPAFDEETFGPVAAVVRAKDRKEMVLMANQSQFGLGAAIFTQDLEMAERLARDEIEAGCCFINGFVKSDPRLPFGGIKESGYGRELGIFGIHEFVNIKSVRAE